MAGKAAGGPDGCARPDGTPLLNIESAMENQLWSWAKRAKPKHWKSLGTVSFHVATTCDDPTGFLFVQAACRVAVRPVSETFILMKTGDPQAELQHANLTCGCVAGVVPSVPVCDRSGSGTLDWIREFLDAHVWVERVCKVASAPILENVPGHLDIGLVGNRSICLHVGPWLGDIENNCQSRRFTISSTSDSALGPELGAELQTICVSLAGHISGYVVDDNGALLLQQAGLARLLRPREVELATLQMDRMSLVGNSAGAKEMTLGGGIQGGETKVVPDMPMAVSAQPAEPGTTGMPMVASTLPAQLETKIVPQPACARDGCLFLRTWHPTHCCEACLQNGTHGEKCERSHAALATTVAQPQPTPESEAQVLPILTPKDQRRVAAEAASSSGASNVLIRPPGLGPMMPKAASSSGATPKSRLADPLRPSVDSSSDFESDSSEPDDPSLLEVELVSQCAESHTDGAKIFNMLW